MITSPKQNEGFKMEPELYCRVVCVETPVNIYREAQVYDVFLIDSEYYVMDNTNNIREVFRSCSQDGVWLSLDGLMTTFNEVA